MADLWTLKQITELGYTPIAWLSCASCRKYFYIVHKHDVPGQEDEHLLLPTTPADVFASLPQIHSNIRFVELFPPAGGTSPHNGRPVIIRPSR